VPTHEPNAVAAVITTTPDIKTAATLVVAALASLVLHPANPKR
jgi:hypothetical protein